jgi:hypothetical protein
MQSYLELVRETRSARLQEMLDVTDQCLRQLATSLRLEHLLPRPDPTGETLSQVHGRCLDLQSGGIQHNNGGGVAAASDMWSRLAASLVADIEGQPPLLTGGKLRDYQMQVRIGLPPRAVMFLSLFQLRMQTQVVSVANSHSMWISFLLIELNNVSAI